MSAVDISETTIYQPVVVKTLASQEQLIRELLRSTVVGFFQNGSSPVGVSGNCLMFNKIQGVTLREIWVNLAVNQQDILLTKLVDELLKIREKYQLSDSSFLKKLNLDLDWGSFVSNCVRYLEESTDLRIKKFSDILLNLMVIDSNLTLTHGDLGLSNVMLSGTELKLIDFEHVVEAPLEFDLAPSFFWKDGNSLPLAKIYQAFIQKGDVLDQKLIEKLVILYLVNQLRLAESAKDPEKYQQLLLKACERKLI